MGALERRVSLWSVEKDLFASHYILLVSPPGVGKSMVISEIRDLWKSAGLIVGPDAATKAAMVDELAKAARTIKMPDGSLNVFHSLQVASPEFGNLIKEHDLETLNFYNKIWDCEKDHSERLRYGPATEIDIEYPQMTILAGTQPAYLGAILPDSAYGMGFTARLVLIHSDQAIRPKLFSKRDDKAESSRQAEHKKLIEGLKKIVAMAGTMKIADDAAEFFEDWHQRNDDAPDHPKLLSYSVRRTLTAQKIAMGLTAAQGKMKIDLKTAEATLFIMRQAEASMPEIFKGLKVPESSSVMGELHNFAYAIYMRNQRAPVPEHMLVNFLKSKVEIFKVDSIMKHMVTAGLFSEAPGKQEPGKFEILGKRFIPSDPQ